MNTQWPIPNRLSTPPPPPSPPPASSFYNTPVHLTPPGAISYYPFKMSYPASYSTDGKLKTLARIPIAKSAVFTGSDIPVSGGTLSDGPICMSNLGSKLRQQGALAKSIKFAGVAMGMIGADFCIELPGLDTASTDLKFGLKISGSMFDKTKIDLTKFTALLPKAYNTVPDPTNSAWTDLKTAAGDADAKGFVDLLNHGKCTASPCSFRNLSLYGCTT